MVPLQECQIVLFESGGPEGSMVAKWINNFVNSILSPDLDQRFVVSCSFVMVCPHSSSLTAHFYLICGHSSIKLQFALLVLVLTIGRFIYCGCCLICSSLKATTLAVGRAIVNRQRNPFILSCTNQLFHSFRWTETLKRRSFSDNVAM